MVWNTGKKKVISENWLDFSRDLQLFPLLLWRGSLYKVAIWKMNIRILPEKGVPFEEVPKSEF